MKQLYTAALCVAIGTSALADTLDTDEKITEADLARHTLIPVFDILDCTNQGFIDGGEIDEHFPVLFNHFDRNGDAMLGRKEYVSSDDAGKARLQAAMFDGMDTDADGKVTSREYRDQVIHLIRVADSDDDDEVTMQELQSAGRASKD